MVSPAWLHDLIRVDPADCDRGAHIYKGLEQLEIGAVSMRDYPYDDRQCRIVTHAEASTVSAFRIKGWRRVPTDKLDQIKGQLAQGHPVIFGAVLNDEFMRARGQVPWDAKRDQGRSLGGHAMTLVGYDDRSQLFTFINSWGSDWGQSGYGQMTYGTFSARVHSAYVIDPLVPPIRPVPDEPAPRPAADIRVLDDLDYACARVTEETDAGALVLRGFVSEAADREALRAKFGSTHRVETQLRPWPQCEALLILANGAPEAAALNVPETELTQGDPFSFTVRAPGFSSHLHLSYFQADGSVVHLSQSAASNLRTLLPGAVQIYGDGEEGRPAYKVSGPFGDEMLLSITTRSPLFDAARPQVEDHRDFLTALRAATIAFEEDGQGRFYSSAYVPIHTKEN